MATFTLQCGRKIPAVGLGTFRSKPGEVGEAVKAALKAGYKHIDCASAYANQAEIGAVLSDAFKAGQVKREELWVTSKLFNNEHHDVRGAVEKSLKDLQLEYLDLYLIHWPVAWEPNTNPSVRAKIPLQQTWVEMEKLVDAGLVKSIGVSNYTVALLDDLLSYARIHPQVNQVELHPYLQQPRLREYCTKHNIHLTAYAPLGGPGDKSPIHDDVVSNIAKQLNVSTANVLLKWGVLRGFSVIPKSITEARIVDNFKSNFDLSEDQLKQIDGLEKNLRIYDPVGWGPSWIPIFN
jgi:diketogulonate reductase-like aldo/keto reductase